MPTAISITEGKWHHEPDPYNPDSWRSNFYLDNKGNGEIETMIDKRSLFPMPVFKWAGGKKSITIDGIDRMPEPGKDELIAMDTMVAESAPLSHGTHKIPLLKMQIGEDGYLYDGYFIESGGPLILATGEKQKILKEAAAAGPVELDLNIPGRPGLNAWLATPALVQDGENSPMPEPFYHLDFHTRTALGQSADGKFYLIYVDGTSVNRIASHGGRFGVTLYQMQKLANHLGLINAANLDDGVFSSIMVIDGKVMGQDPEFHMITPYDDNRWVGDMVLIVDDED
ncbi:hypothetical protein AXK11_05620 [Cephaloticoccus primus]|uniref:Phosphodiester glycosidase domain-containing protein n=1 Tax=Cephaloticoccus primus TaxID=1548207 RepID=A0A139SMS4_9BACT|nr:hypothetical protein AXK11_05620 [Cephaloticoccus primus]